MSSFTLWLLTLFGFISANARAVSSKSWNAADAGVCTESTTDSSAICLGMYVSRYNRVSLRVGIHEHASLSAEGDPLFEWRVELDCTVPNTLTVSYTNGDGESIANDYITSVEEVRLECYHNANQVVIILL